MYRYVGRNGDVPHMYNLPADGAQLSRYKPFARLLAAFKTVQYTCMRFGTSNAMAAGNCSTHLSACCVTAQLHGEGYQLRQPASRMVKGYQKAGEVPRKLRISQRAVAWRPWLGPLPLIRSNTAPAGRQLGHAMMMS